MMHLIKSWLGQMLLLEEECGDSTIGLNASFAIYWYLTTSDEIIEKVIILWMLSLLFLLTHQTRL